MKRSSSNTSTSYWSIVIVFVIVIGLFATVYAGTVAGQNIKKSLLQRSDSIAELLDADQIEKLAGDTSDLDSPEYQMLKAHFEQLRDINPDIRFAYLLAQSKERTDSYFIVDSESPDSEDYSYPGQTYPEGNQDVANIYTNQSGTVLPITRDRWGSWLSAFSPVTDSHGTIIAVFGMDIPAGVYYSRTVLTALVPFLLTMLLVGVLLWLKRRALYQQRYVTEKAFFLSFASHEIRSPLASVAWALKAITNKNIPTEKSHVFLGRAEQSIQHILATVDDVLSLQRTEGLASQNLALNKIPIHSLLTSSIESLSLVSSEKECHIVDQTTTADRDIVDLVDVTLFKRVLSNLLINAMKYSPKGSPVTVKLQQNKEGWVVEVHNSGEAISPTDQAKIFKGFYRTDSAERSNEHGSGLGLMLCHDIIQRHGGQLELESTAETGTTFRINMKQQKP